MQPDAATLRTVPSWEWLKMHVDPARSRAMVTVARVAETLERAVPLGPLEAERRLRTLPGIGEWTCAEVRQRTFGDPDAVSFGDYHVAKDVGWALTGTPFTTRRCAPTSSRGARSAAGCRRSWAMAGLRRPRHGARMAPRTHLPASVTRPRS